MVAYNYGWNMHYNYRGINS